MPYYTTVTRVFQEELKPQPETLPKDVDITGRGVTFECSYMFYAARTFNTGETTPPVEPFEVTVKIAGTPDPETGRLIDFDELAHAVTQLDNCLINHYITNPTLEVIAIYLTQETAKLDFYSHTHITITVKVNAHESITTEWFKEKPHAV